LFSTTWKFRRRLNSYPEGRTYPEGWGWDVGLDDRGRALLTFRDLLINENSNGKLSAKNARKRQLRKEKRSTLSLDQLLEQTSGMWKEGDALTYQRRVCNE